MDLGTHGRPTTRAELRRQERAPRGGPARASGGSGRPTRRGRTLKVTVAAGLVVVLVAGWFLASRRSPSTSAADAALVTVIHSAAGSEPGAGTASPDAPSTVVGDPLSTTSAVAGGASSPSASGAAGAIDRSAAPGAAGGGASGSGPGSGTGLRAPGNAAPVRGGSGRLAIGLAYSDILPWESAASRSADLADAVATHSGWIRLDLPWIHIQPDSSAQLLWERYDPTVRAARSLGLDILFTVTQAPPWARDPSCSDQPSCPPASATEFARFVGLAAKHYGALGAHTFEIWNEENLPSFWTVPDAARYGALVSAAADAAHASDSQARVIIGGLAAAAPGSPVVDQLDFLAGVCGTGACRHVDGVGYHPYTFPTKASLRPAWATAWTRISVTSPSIRSVLADYGVGSLPLWITEYGAPTGGPGRMSDGSPERPEAPTDHVSESVQAGLATDVVATAAADPQIAALFWYQQRDVAQWQPSREGYFGLRRADGSAKPAFAAFASAVARVR